jgi:hypothetical protein
LYLRFDVNFEILARNMHANDFIVSWTY